jgi:hypothetical protein
MSSWALDLTQPEDTERERLVANPIEFGVHGAGDQAQRAKQIHAPLSQRRIEELVVSQWVDRYPWTSSEMSSAPISGQFAEGTLFEG